MRKNNIVKMESLRILPYKFDEVKEKETFFILIRGKKEIGTVNKESLDHKLLWLLKTLAMPE